MTYVYESLGYWDKEKQQARSKRKCIVKLNDETGEIIYSKSYLESKELDEIGTKLGIEDDLKKCFPEIHEQMRSLAYYLVMEDRNPMSRFPKWSRTHAHPYGRDIPSQRSSELLELITEDSKIFFLRCKVKDD